MTTDRKFALTKITQGDYLLPSNDARTLWRITAYVETGDAEYSSDGKTWHKLRGTFWQTAKYDQPIAGVELPDDFLEWEHWIDTETGFGTRGQAVEAALRGEPSPT